MTQKDVVGTSVIIIDTESDQGRHKPLLFHHCIRAARALNTECRVNGHNPDDRHSRALNNHASNPYFTTVFFFRYKQDN